MSDHQTYESPSVTGAFFRGFISSAASGALMSGITAGVSLMFGLTPLGWAGFFMISLATGLFGGVMAVKHSLFDQGEQGQAPTYIPVAVQGMSGPAIAPTVTPDMAPEQASARSWTQSVGREGNTQNRVQEILANGSMNDKDRASAILAAREAELANPTQTARA